jgi:hypothetical protein
VHAKRRREIFPTGSQTIYHVVLLVRLQKARELVPFH